MTQQQIDDHAELIGVFGAEIVRHEWIGDSQLALHTDLWIAWIPDLRLGGYREFQGPTEAAARATIEQLSTPEARAAAGLLPEGA